MDKETVCSIGDKSDPRDRGERQKGERGPSNPATFSVNILHNTVEGRPRPQFVRMVDAPKSRPARHLSCAAATATVVCLLAVSHNTPTDRPTAA